MNVFSKNSKMVLISKLLSLILILALVGVLVLMPASAEEQNEEAILYEQEICEEEAPLEESLPYDQEEDNDLAEFDISEESVLEKVSVCSELSVQTSALTLVPFNATIFVTQADVTNDGGTYIISAAGEYEISGNILGRIVVNTPDQVTLTLNNAHVKSSSSPLQLTSGSADVTIVLKDGTDNSFECTSSATATNSNNAGINVPSNASLVIEGNTGSLTALSGPYSAGIGAAANNACGDITIKGGNITATARASAATGSGNGAGIGGGGGNTVATNSNAGTITIEGTAVVHATSFGNGAGIGGGGNGESTTGSNATVNIYGNANVTAISYGNGAGIGGGGNEINTTAGGGGTINIYGNASVSATGKNAGSGIGGGGSTSGSAGPGGTISIYDDAKLTAVSGGAGSGIGGGGSVSGSAGAGGSITISGSALQTPKVTASSASGKDIGSSVGGGIYIIKSGNVDAPNSSNITNDQGDILSMITRAGETPNAIIAIAQKNDAQAYYYYARTNDTGEAVNVWLVEEADYSAVDSLISIATSEIGLGIYTDESVAELNDKISDVVRGLLAVEQATVDAFADEIEKAILKLKIKYADYNDVNTAIATIPEDLTVYEAEKVNAIILALTKIVEGKDITEQGVVDTYASDLNSAINALALRDADYAAVNLAISKAPLDLSAYSSASVSALTSAISAVETGKKITEQRDVDAYAGDIWTAIINLEIESANYAGVNNAVSKIPVDLGKYTDTTVNAVVDALAGIIRGKNKTEQIEVDGYASTLVSAVNALELRPLEKTSESEIVYRDTVVKWEYIYNSYDSNFNSPVRYVGIPTNSASSSYESLLVSQSPLLTNPQVLTPGFELEESTARVTENSEINDSQTPTASGLLSEDSVKEKRSTNVNFWIVPLILLLLLWLLLFRRKRKKDDKDEIEDFNI